MSKQGLQLEVRRYCGAPLITAKGHIDGWHNQTFGSLLRSFNLKGYDDMIVDLSGVGLVGMDGKTALVDVMRRWNPEMMVHFVATGEVAQLLGERILPFSSHLCASLEIACEQICRSHRSVQNSIPSDLDWQLDDELLLAA
jgi:hypothetical protein